MSLLCVTLTFILSTTRVMGVMILRTDEPDPRLEPPMRYEANAIITRATYIQPSVILK